MHGDFQSGMMSPPLFKLDQPPPLNSDASNAYSVGPQITPDNQLYSQGKKSLISSQTVVSTQDSEDLVDTDEEDEFFDAIESNALPNVVVSDALVKSPELDSQSSSLISMDQYEVYRDLREKLPMEKDTRPPTSLWSVLKHSIGKDLTKISFPVFFNEPTSMLQRMVRTCCESKIMKF